MGAKKTGRKKKSEYRKYKDHLKKLKAIETARAIMLNAIALSQSVIQAQSYRNASKCFEEGGVVSPNKSEKILTEVVKSDPIPINIESLKYKNLHIPVYEIIEREKQNES